MKIYAFIAPDGVGKSTLTNLLRQELEAMNIVVDCLYMGTGDGDGWKLRKVITRVGVRLKAKLKKNNVAQDANKPGPQKRAGLLGYLLHCLFLIYGLMVAVEKKYKLEKVSGSGNLVLSDRWPQIFETGILDGPICYDREIPRTLGWLFNLQVRALRSIMFRSEVSFVLMSAPYAVSAKRKPGAISSTEYARRVSVMRLLSDDATLKTTILDASQPASALVAIVTNMIVAESRLTQ